jgi:mono/diheme cytochrome c family protein
LGLRLWLLAALLLFPLAGQQRPLDFSRDIQPVLSARCIGCHGEAQQMNGLRLDSAAALLEGSYAGAVIVPGDSAGSRLVERVTTNDPSRRMPAVGDPLRPEEIQALRAWIDQGAKASDTPAPASKAAALWSFQPVRRPAVPAGDRNPIDAFVLDRLRREGIAPSPEADRVTLLRRTTLDLTGLPPTPQETAAFLADTQPEAYARLVDRLLASPHYGEKWARYWLDLSRYADSDGYEKDLFREHAWRYRHWLIEALNRDLPFDQFTREQIAGDLLPYASVEQKVATGFHRNALKNREAGVSREQAQFEEIVDRTNTVGTVWLGLTVGCAQCHDHKFDPITQRDYYRLFAFFNSADEVTIDAPLPGELGPHLSARPQYRAGREALLEEYGVSGLQAAWEANIRSAMDDPGQNTDWDFAVTSLRASMDRAERLLRKDAASRTPREADEVTDYFIARPGPDVAKDKELTDKLKELRGKLSDLEKSLPPLSQAYVLEANPEPVVTHIALRGDYQAKGLTVEPGTPAVLFPFPKGDGPARLRLAEWLVSRENPLTARVMVNRLWQELFGRGIVATSEDFGTQGEKPSHPELLDWLAAEFMESGWSMKHLLRTMVLSATYRQSSKERPELAERDPENTLFARQSRLRLPAELIRDAALSASGLLYPAIGGQSVRPPQPDGISKLTYGDAKWQASEGPERYRRGLYVQYQRTSPHPQLVNFDAPDTNTACTRRRRSNTPLQALNLLNDPVFLESAQALALRVLREARTAWNDRLDYAFQLCLARGPEAVERDRVATFFQQQLAAFEADAGNAGLLAPNTVPGAAAAEVAAWTALGRALMNLDEFITRE